MADKERTTDFNWIAEHGLEIYEKYRGKWIAVCDGEVVGIGDTAVEASEQAEKARPGRRFILEAIEHDTDVVYTFLPLA
jgi:Family of unknown function (DUF5678)